MHDLSLRIPKKLPYNASTTAQIPTSARRARMNHHSNIRVSIQFTQSTVFAGEDVQCIITFKNAAQPYGSDRHHDELPSYPQRKIPAVPARRPSIARHAPGHGVAQRRRGHKLVHSSSTPSTPVLGEISGENQASVVARPAHGRSLSIRSISSNTHGAGEWANQDAEPSGRRPARGHMRSSSLQMVPRRGHGSPLIGMVISAMSVQYV
jgi:hypothetical protein